MKQFLFICSIFFLSQISIFAQDTPPTDSTAHNNIVINKKTIWPTFIDVGYQAISLNYKEHVPEDPTFKSEESGIVPGFFIGTTSNQRYPFFVSFYFTYNKANEDYDGGLVYWDHFYWASIPIASTTSSNFLKYDLALHYRYKLSKDLILSPFCGIADRKWIRKVGIGTTYGNEEDYYWKNISLGGELVYKAHYDFTIGLAFAYNIMFDGNIDVLQTDEPKTNLELGNENSFRVELPINISTESFWGIIIKPFYEHYSFGKSNVDEVQSIYEPNSNTNNIGISFGLRFNIR